jgi:hypothetical protein
MVDLCGSRHSARSGSRKLGPLIVGYRLPEFYGTLIEERHQRQPQPAAEQK